LTGFNRRSTVRARDDVAKGVPVNIKEIANQLVDWCNAGKNFDVMRTMYTPDIVSVEADGQETKGQQAVIQKSERWAAANVINGQVVRGPFFNGPNQFAATFTFNVVRKETGKPETLEEVAVYTVVGDKIAREQFFYEGEH
jgi:ketosteroid isomerase-like protein